MAPDTMRVGCTYLHCAFDDQSLVADVEDHDNEKAETLVGFWSRAQDWIRAEGMAVDEVMSDNGSNFRSRIFADKLAEQGIKCRHTRPNWPQTNGKVERFNRTMADEFLYSFTFRSEIERRLDRWVHNYIQPSPKSHRHRWTTRNTRPQRLWLLQLGSPRR